MLVSLSSIVFAQNNDIQLFPFSNDSLSVTETSPIYLSDTEIIIFFCNKQNDTIFISRTTNGASSWSVPEFVIESGITGASPLIYLSSLITPSNRIILSWSVVSVGIFSIYSDNFGFSWSQPVLILGGGNTAASRRNYNLNLSQISNNKIWLSFNLGLNGGICYYRQSTDNGQTWGDNTDATLFIFSNTSTPYFGEVSFVSINENEILAVYQSSSTNQYDIFMRRTSDGGQSWGDDILIEGTELVEKRPRAIKTSDNKIWLVYQREYPTIKAGIMQNDIFYKTSIDNGISWSGEKRFTKYIGDDNSISISKNNTKPFISFVTQRFSNFLKNKKIAYGIVGETIELYTPPFIYDIIQLASGDINPLKLSVNVRAKDDDSIKVVSVLLEDSQKIYLYDDGLHNDKEAGDFIFGNDFLLNDYPAGTDGFINVNRITIPIIKNGSLGGQLIYLPIECNFTVEDLDNNITSGFKEFFLNIKPLGYYDGAVFLYAGGFLISGYTNGVLWGAGQASSSLIENFIPGRVNDSSNPKNSMYAINSSDQPFGANWQRWRDAVEIGADFYDGNNDGIYNPVDLNNNGVWDKNEDMPYLLGDRTNWTVFNDGQPGNQRVRFAGVDPQGIEIQQTVFASSLPELENVLFIRYKITNKGTVSNVLDSVILGFWSDPDLGADFDDDLVGCDTLLQSSICYNESDIDTTNNPGIPSFGHTPPAFFTTLLQGAQTEGTLNDTAYVKRGPQFEEEFIPGKKNTVINAFVHYVSSDPLRGDPNDENELRNYMRGRFKLGQVFNPCEPDPWGGLFGGVDCSKINLPFWYSGDPVTNFGWICTTGTDQRMLLSTEPFTLVKDNPVEVIYAYILGRGTDRLNSIIIARENVQKVMQEYLNNFSSLAYNPGEPPLVLNNYELYQNYPNPFNPSTTIRYDVFEDGIVTLKIYDILGQEVRTLVNEFQPQRRYEVQFNSAGLASGVYIYRLQVNDYVQSKKMMLLK
jgi:hypothetical protein